MNENDWYVIHVSLERKIDWIKHFGLFVVEDIPLKNKDVVLSKWTPFVSSDEIGIFTSLLPIFRLIFTLLD